jgi:DNA invertase Pin-like site-specific DNA recombinase
MQQAALEAAGVDDIILEQAVSGYSPRPALAAALSRLQQGDSLVVWKLDRLGRRMVETVQTVEDLSKRGIEVESLTENIDTRTPSGRAMLGMLATMAQYERDTIRERTIAGQKAARNAGKRFGRPKALTADQIAHAAKLVEDGEKTIPQAARLLNVGVSTLYRALKP